MGRILVVVALLASQAACTKSSQGTTVDDEPPKACMTDDAREVTTQPDFRQGYEYCATGSRAIGRPATLACLEKQTGLPEACASCYSWYKACVLQNCFKSCMTPRPEPYCLLCRRNACRGQFYQCAGTIEVFPGHKN